MSETKRPRNLFYALAMLLGIAFSLTACSYGVMMLHANRGEGLPQPGQPGHALTDLLDRHGTAILAGELAGLALFTVAAIWLDQSRGRRSSRK